MTEATVFIAGEEEVVEVKSGSSDEDVREIVAEDFNVNPDDVYVHSNPG